MRQSNSCPCTVCFTLFLSITPALVSVDCFVDLLQFCVVYFMVHALLDCYSLTAQGRGVTDVNFSTHCRTSPQYFKCE